MIGTVFSGFLEAKLKHLMGLEAMPPLLPAGGVDTEEAQEGHWRV